MGIGVGCRTYPANRNGGGGRPSTTPSSTFDVDMELFDHAIHTHAKFGGGSVYGYEFGLSRSIFSKNRKVLKNMIFMLSNHRNRKEVEIQAICRIICWYLEDEQRKRKMFGRLYVENMSLIEHLIERARLEIYDNEDADRVATEFLAFYTYNVEKT